MSDNLSAAAETLGLPEALVRRSAAARATETGADVEEILAAWASGEGPAPSAAPSEAEPAPSEAGPEDVEPDEEAKEAEAEPTPTPPPVARPEVVIEIPEPEPVPAGGAPAFGAAALKPPVLVGARDNPMSLLSGVVALFIVVALVAVLGPALPLDAPGARTSHIEYSPVAEEGQQIYRALGCSFCHTQMVRPVVADVGLGAVTLNDTNQVLGVRRFGPDLSDAGTRLTATQIEGIISGLGGHPPHRLDGDDMAALVAYLVESQTSPEEPEELDLEEGDAQGTEEGDADETDEGDEEEEPGT